MERQKVDPFALQTLERYHVPTNLVVHPTLVHFAPREIICHAGDTMEMLLFLYHGRAKAFFTAENGAQLILCFYRDSGVIDDMELFLRDGSYHISCQAITEVTAVALPAEENRELLLSDNEFLRQTCTSFATSLLRNRNHFQNILYSVEERLCSYIALTETETGWSENLTNTAELLGVSYRHLLRALRQLCERGVLRKGPQGYSVLDRAAFSRLDRGFYAPTE